MLKSECGSVPIRELVVYVVRFTNDDCWGEIRETKKVGKYVVLGETDEKCR